jgi:hypothetical protein
VRLVQQREQPLADNGFVETGPRKFGQLGTFGTHIGYPRAVVKPDARKRPAAPGARPQATANSRRSFVNAASGACAAATVTPARRWLDLLPANGRLHRERVRRPPADAALDGRIVLSAPTYSLTASAPIRFNCAPAPLPSNAQPKLLNSRLSERRRWRGPSDSV